MSTWLAAGTPPLLVAKWAGYIVLALLTVYAHAVGQEETTRMRIDQALADDDKAA